MRKLYLIFLCFVLISKPSFAKRWLLSQGAATSSFTDLLSVQFNASNQLINFGNNISYEYSQAWTISAWIKASSLTQNFNSILGKTVSSPYKGFELQIKNQTITPAIANSISVYSEVTTSSNVITSTSTWYHVAWVNSGSGTSAGQTIYINGSSVAVTNNHDNLGGNTIINSTNFTIGSRADGTGTFSGTVDDVSVFNAALSSGNITTIYNSGHPGDLTGMSNLQFWTWLGDGGDSATALNGFVDHSGNGFNGTGNGSLASGNIVSDHP